MVLALLILITTTTLARGQQNEQPYLGVRTVIGKQGPQVVEIVPGSPAETAGFRVNDVIIAVNDAVVSTTNPLETILRKLQPGTTAQFTVLRGADRLQISVTLSARLAETTTRVGSPTFPISTATAPPTGTRMVVPDATRTPTAAAPVPVASRGYLGIRLSNSPQGVQVVEVIPQSPANIAGITTGDIITAVDDQPVQRVEQVQAILNSKAAGDPVTIHIKRFNNQPNGITLRLGTQPAPSATTSPFPTGTVTITPPTNTPIAPGPVDMLFLRFGFRAAVNPEGFYVIEVIADSPAALGGLRVNDIIVSVNKIPYHRPDITTLVTWLLYQPTVSLIVLRDGQRVQLTLDAARVERREQTVYLGVGYQVLTATIAAERNLSVDYGALVIAVSPESPAYLAGIKTDDVIIAVDGEKVDAKRTLAIRMLPYQLGDTVALTVVRGKQTLQIQVALTNPGNS